VIVCWFLSVNVAAVKASLSKLVMR
jgi:hypothetical protein